MADYKITDSQCETLRAILSDDFSTYRSATISDALDLFIELEVNGLGQAQVALDTLLKLSKLLETTTIYVETNDDMNKAPSCEILCVGVAEGWKHTQENEVTGWISD